MGQRDPYEVALQLARKKLSENPEKRRNQTDLLAQCEKLKGKIDTTKYWGMRLDKALSSGDFVAVEAYLPHVTKESS